MIDHESRSCIETVANRGIVEKLREKYGRGGIDDDERVGLIRELVSYSAPAIEVAHIFWHVDRTVKRDLLVGERLLECQSGAQRITVRIFGLNDADMMLVFDEIAEFVVHVAIITDWGLRPKRQRLNLCLSDYQ